MKTTQTANAMVNQLVAPIVETLASENGTRIVLDTPIFHESISGNLFEKFNTDQIEIVHLMKNGFVTTQDLENTSSTVGLEQLASPYEELPLEVLAEIVNVVKAPRQRFDVM